MRKIDSILVVVLLGVGTIVMASTGGEEVTDDRRDLYRFILFYYQKPSPEKLVSHLDVMLKENIADETDFSVAYFFARASGKDPNIVNRYTELFDKGTHRQRLFLLKILKVCGDKNTEKWFRERLSEGRFINERDQIEEILEEGMSADFNVLDKPVNDARDLGLLCMEFSVTGEKKAILRIIEFLGLEDVRLKKYALNNPKEPNVIREEAIDILKNSCRLHNMVLEICKKEVEKSKSPIKEKLEEIIDGVDGSVSTKRWIESKPKLKVVRGAKGWALGCSAILMEKNSCRHDTLAPEEISERNVKDERESFDKWWGVRTRKDLFETLDRLEQSGHRKRFEKTGQLVTQMSDEEFAGLVEQNRNDKDKVGELETARKYYKQLDRKSILGWDFARYICVCRWGYTIGLMTEEEAWDKIMPAAKRLQETFDSWEDLGSNYLIGRQFWSREEQEKDGYMFEDAFQRLLDKKSSPWNIYAWDINLDSWQDVNEQDNSSKPAKSGQEEKEKQQ